jgi:replicative DNA helicase
VEKIKRVKVNSDQEKNLITGLITSDRFIRELYPILHPKNLKSTYSRRIAKWCLEYYKKYELAPKKEIQKIFQIKLREEKIPEEEENYITEFLKNLSKQYEQKADYNETFYLDESEKYLAERKVSLLFEDVADSLESGKVSQAETLITEFVRERRPLSSSIDIINDKEAILAALREEEDIMFRYPGALGNIVGDMQRGDFVSFMAPMKRGKTWWLENFGYRCLIRRLSVLFVTLEMPKNQVIRRFHQILSAETKRQCEIVLPKFSDDNEIIYETIKKKGLTAKRVLSRLKEMQPMIAGGNLRILCRPSRSMNVEDLKSEIYNLSHYEKFFPDVVIIDYADILAPEKGSGNEVRHRIDETWAKMRSLAQEINGLVVTATQASRSTFTTDIEEQDTPEDIRKLAHVTHMIILNQSREEKKALMMRVGVLVARENDFHLDNEALVLYQYAIGQSCIDSRLKHETSY